MRNNMSVITIENLEVFANHGVLSEENTLGQKFMISSRLYLDISKAARDDNLDASVNYALVCDFITKYMKEHTFKLIETLADRMSLEILKSFELLEGIELTVKKPWAPIGLPVDCVMITVEKFWKTAYLSIGSNMGDKKSHLDYAVSSLEADDRIKLLKASSFITTEPYGFREQEEFLNGVLKISTVYSPHQLLEKVNEIEAMDGRQRLIHWGPRTLDIDILFYEDERILDDDLIIPHPDIENRDFVLTPFAEIEPYFLHPIKKKTILEMWNDLK